MTGNEILIALAIKYKGDWNVLYQKIKSKDVVNDNDLEDIYKSYKGKAISILDERYPNSLKHILRPPFVLFYEGDLSLLSDNNKKLAVVGTRKPKEFYVTKMQNIIKKLSKDFVIVSGLARGIDGFAHQAALDANLKTIAVLGSGLQYNYPIENLALYDEVKRKGLVVTEFPYEVSPTQSFFPQRNRIIAGLSKHGFIPEAGLRSGTSITANLLCEQNKTVMCLPSTDYGESLCNELIKEGATLVENAEDIESNFSKF